VLHVAWSGHVGGIERQLEALVRATDERGPPVHRVLFLDGRGPVGEALEASGLARRLRMGHGWSPLGLWRLTRELRRTRPRVLHLHTASFGAQLATLLALPRTRRLYTEHLPQVLDRAPRFRIVYALLRLAPTRFVALSPGLARAMEACGADPARIAVVPNAVCVPLRRDPSPRQVTRTIGLVGRLVEPLRAELLVDVLAELRRRGASCRAILVGDGPARAALARYAEASGVASLVEFAGEQEDVVPWLDRLDVFLMTREQSVYPLALLEAMARGVPVVAMASRGGLAELAGQGGLLLPDREIETAADTIERLLSSATEREALRGRGLEVAAEHQLESVLSRLDELYGLEAPATSRGASRDGATVVRGGPR
jgi:glycosyltransferase involved in cell wall biosynthesis